MAAENQIETGLLKDRHILLSLDESENSKRALIYTAEMLGGIEGFRATLLHIIPEPPEDYFPSDSERHKWIEEKVFSGTQLLEKYSEQLVQAGFEKNKIQPLVEVRKCTSIAECIVDVQKQLNCCTVIVGRRGISKKEEFIFGSTSSKLLHSLKSCAIWVIE
ncbi:MAG: universal stress protein [Spirochaetia bacterium]|nr:universal stress protein [Spirochaetia bacterium]